MQKIGQPLDVVRLQQTYITTDSFSENFCNSIP